MSIESISLSITSSGVRNEENLFLWASSKRDVRNSSLPSAEKGWVVLRLAIQPDHIHIFVRVWPSDSASEVVKELKGATSFFLRREFEPVLSKLPALWTRSYFSSTSGAVSAKTIQEYIDAQKGL